MEEKIKYSASFVVEAFRNRPADSRKAQEKFAVLVGITDLDGEAHILYERRSASLHTQPGEICFPGGRIEPGETQKEACLREVEEEIGLKEADLDLVGALDILVGAGGRIIYPYLAKIREGALDRIQASPSEVAEVFLVPVSFFETSPYRYSYEVDRAPGKDFDYGKIGFPEGNYRWRPIKNEIISWEYKGRFIWGLTARITMQLLGIVQGAADGY